MVEGVYRMKKLIMSDLDNTLLPLYTQKEFVEIWFRDVAKKFYEYGLNQAVLLNAVNDGCRAMIFNDGKRSNIDVFYDVVTEKSGYARAQLDPVFADYYSSTFANVKEIAGENPYAPEIARLMREKAEYAVIATMPMFPIEAAATRMGWIGLKPEMFDLVTTCDYSSYCKPNPGFFREILEDFGVDPKDALMIGNDVREDMEPCEELGIDVFLVTDNIITHGLEYDRFRQGTTAELIDFLKAL